MKARPCAVATCPALARPRREFCAAHLTGGAFSVDGKARWLCVGCAAAIVRGGAGPVYADADATCAAMRSIGAPACFRCGAPLAPAGAPRHEPSPKQQHLADGRGGW